jgi:hypothetical protein
VTTFWEQLTAEIIYHAAMLPCEHGLGLADCARAVGMLVCDFQAALRQLDVVRCGGGPVIVCDDLSAGFGPSASAVAGWLQSLAGLRVKP